MSGHGAVATVDLMLLLEPGLQLHNCGEQGLDFVCLYLVGFGEFSSLSDGSHDILFKEGEASFHGCPHIL